MLTFSCILFPRDSIYVLLFHFRPEATEHRDSYDRDSSAAPNLHLINEYIGIY